MVDLRGAELRPLAVARQLVGAAAAHVHGGVVGRHLLDGAPERRQRRLDGLARSGGGPSPGVSSPSMSSVVERGAEDHQAR